MANRVKMSMEERAKQFAPFASLRGYYSMVRGKEEIKEDRRELSETEAEILSEKIKEIKKGIMAKITYYDKDRYKVLEGMVSSVDFDNRKLKIVKTLINFDEILNVEMIHD